MKQDSLSASRGPVAALGTAVALLALAAPAAEPWQDPAVNSENRMPARMYLPYGGFVLSLDGTWSFAWEGSADGRIASGDPSKLETPFSIDVPSCVETRGRGVPHYVNIRYPHPKTQPTIDPKYNPTMLYRRTFAVPESWKGRRVVLRFEGVASCCEVWVNGRRAGYFEDARLPSEFDVTEFVSFGEAAENVIVARVRKWCDGSYVEDQDMIRYSGIFRSVTLRSEPRDGIEDFSFTTVPDAAYAEWTCRLELFGGLFQSPGFHGQHDNVGTLDALAVVRSCADSRSSGLDGVQLSLRGVAYGDVLSLDKHALCQS